MIKTHKNDRKQLQEDVPEICYSSSNIQYFHIEKLRLNLHKMINHNGGIMDDDEIVKLGQRFDEVVIEYYNDKVYKNKDSGYHK
ncbi:hypothetical protein acsn021_11830 [Anaerocolumna cellulosilytica]|uniref:Uncharacterized protein n=1 Tax=Anaerocolumna cellulosilytica TaxID=433286 RepID=A0A6S6QSM5_9FIRM|nr:Spo0E family sporulation regulatory protein-aspartic acid phosphatase [Anaerocolumna cellulosilytica]MBB5196081.1 hypothetical protein [Anaerocolumna cellulosilytica]BCJ93614.1 hypothetical protein acsn021_11830 [Anaerocolumna cellulosilytica]